MSTKVSCTWKEGMAFESLVTGHRILMDADAEVGGNDTGPRPKPLLLSALGGCTGMDVVAILAKMQLNPSWFNIEIEAEMTDRHPKYYDRIKLVYQFKESDGLDRDKVEKAVKLSQERYCGVSALLGKGAELSYEIAYL